MAAGVADKHLAVRVADEARETLAGLPVT